MKRARSYCPRCEQVTTQTQDGASGPWKCLCCESARLRSAEATKKIKQRGRAKDRLNVSF